MEFAASLAPWTHFSAAFLDFSDCDLYQELEAEARQPYSSLNKDKRHWARCASNPVNKIDEYAVPAIPRWRIDGCASGGTQYFVTPLFLSLRIVPRRVDVFIPDQSRHPAALRRILRSGGTLHVRFTVLEDWSSRYDFGEILNNVPFGSHIVIGSVTASITNTRLRVLPNLQLKKQLLSIAELQALWDFPISFWPSAVDLDELAQLSQIHDSISVVQIPSLHGERRFVFKSSTHSYKYIYHELKLLLSMPAHANIIAKPFYIVVAPVLGGEDRSKKVFGFVLEYVQGSTLASCLSKYSLGSTVKPKCQFRWARQITEALIFIKDGPAKFYSELKPDNIMVREPGNDILLIDFEQHANWDTFSAPEIRHIDNLGKAIQVKKLPEEVHRRFQQMLERHAKTKTAIPDDEIYSNPEEGYFRSWISLNPAQRELATVFALGKVLWCIFEGCDHTRNSLLEEYSTPAPIEFLTFRNTPAKLRNLIMRCTAGSEAFMEEEEDDIVRRSDKFYARRRQTQHDNDFGAAREAMEASQAMWKRRAKEMDDFFEAKTRYDEGTASKEDINILGFRHRPTLSEVLNTILEAERV